MIWTNEDDVLKNNDYKLQKKNTLLGSYIRVLTILFWRVIF